MERVFHRVTGQRAGFKEGRFILETRKKFPMMTVVRHWNRLLREILDASSLQTLEVRLDGALSNQPEVVEGVSSYCKVVGLSYL